MNRDSGLAGSRQQLRLRLNLNQLDVGKAALPRSYSLNCT